MHESYIHGDFPEGKEQDYLKRMRQLYYSAISLVDKNIGKILNALEEIGELDNTLIIFASDHGEMLGDHKCFQKMLPYDSCAKIPFIVRYPEKIKKGSKRTDFADLNDILPTVLDVVGIDYPGTEKLPGGSIFKDEKDRSYQYIEHQQSSFRWISIRDEQYKFNYYYGGGREELFDIKSDPHESMNLLEKNPEKYSSERDRLYKVLIEYEKKWGPENYTSWESILKLQDIDCSNLICNKQFPIFSDYLSKTEKETINDFGDEVIEAVKDEPLIKLHELDLDAWERNGAPKKVIEEIKTRLI